MTSSTRPTSSTSWRRSCATMRPTVCSSLRAGSTTLIRLAPLACITRCRVHDTPRLLRRGNQCHTSGSIPAGTCRSSSRITLEIPLTSASNPPEGVAYWRRVGVPVSRRRPGRMNLDRCKVGFVGAGGVAVRHARHLTQLEGCTDRRRDRPGYDGCAIICGDDGRRRGFRPGGTSEHIAGCCVCLCSAACSWPDRGTGALRRNRIVRREAAGAGPADRTAHRRHGTPEGCRYCSRTPLALLAGHQFGSGTT